MIKIVGTSPFKKGVSPRKTSKTNATKENTTKKQKNGFFAGASALASLAIGMIVKHKNESKDSNFYENPRRNTSTPNRGPIIINLNRETFCKPDVDKILCETEKAIGNDVKEILALKEAGIEIENTPLPTRAYYTVKASDVFEITKEDTENPCDNNTGTTIEKYREVSDLPYGSEMQEIRPKEDFYCDDETDVHSLKKQPFIPVVNVSDFQKELLNPTNLAISDSFISVANNVADETYLSDSVAIPLYNAQDLMKISKGKRLKGKLRGKKTADERHPVIYTFDKRRYLEEEKNKSRFTSSLQRIYGINATDDDFSIIPNAEILKNGTKVYTKKFVDLNDVTHRVKFVLDKHDNFIQLYDKQTYFSQEDNSIIEKLTKYNRRDKKEKEILKQTFFKDSEKNYTTTIFSEYNDKDNYTSIGRKVFYSNDGKKNRQIIFDTDTQKPLIDASVELDWKTFENIRLVTDYSSETPRKKVEFINPENSAKEVVLYDVDTREYKALKLNNKGFVISETTTDEP